MSIRLEQALRTSETARFHTVPLARVQSVGEHVYNVTHIAMYIAAVIEKAHPDIPPIDRGHIAYAGMFHDIEEGITGDLPTPLKRATNIRNEIAGLLYAKGGIPGGVPDHRVGAILKMADLVDAIRTLNFYGMTPHADRIEKELRSRLHEMAAIEFLWLGYESRGRDLASKILDRVFAEPMEITDNFNVVRD